MEDAINQTKSEYKFNISWHPFLLNDSIPEEGYDRKEYFKAKFGITDETKSPMFERLNQVGKENGINFSRGTVVPNTFKSHQLIKYAKEIGKQNEVLKIFF
jgi:predicted DsbA family dithiol-disulfide isomerase